MSTFDPEDYGLQPLQENVPRNWRRQMEADIASLREENEQLKAEREVATRDRVFAAAGIPNEGPFAAMRRGYEGDLTVEAVRAEFGPLMGQPGYQEVQQSLAGHQQAAAMAAGAPAATTSSTPNDLAMLKADARRKRNASDFHTQRTKLGEVTNREGVEPKPSGWVLPRQLQQIQ